MNKTFKRITQNGRRFQLLTLPGTNLYKFEIINLYGANIEREMEMSLGLNVYGLSHFIEHLGFHATKDFSTDILLDLLKTEGTYNASTDHDRINYWFKSTMEHVDISTRLVCNYALNDLQNIPKEEFEIEKKVVYNEAKRYADDDQTMFYFNTTQAVCGYHKEDNVIGIPENVKMLRQDDAIELKRIFLANGEQVYNITYDPTVMTEENVLARVNAELDRFPVPAQSLDDVQIDKGYRNLLHAPRLGEFKLENESEQVMTALYLNNIQHYWTDSAANSYLSQYATNTALDDVIREQNGLTYGLWFYEDLIAYEPYTAFMCDVSRGTEGELMELFESSINQSVDAFDEEAFVKFQKTRKLKRVMRNVNQESYDALFWTSIWYPYIIDDSESAFADNIDRATEELDIQHIQYEMVKASMIQTRDLVNNKTWSMVTN